MSPAKVMVVFGTRPEAIKLAPVVQELRARAGFAPVIVATAQHREMLDQVVRLFDLRPDHDLALMTADQDLASLTARALGALSTTIAAESPRLVLVQGDTTTTFAAALAAFYRRVPVGHVEAGLRSHDRTQPFPEETNRTLTTHLSDLHFAPTERAREHLLAEGIAAAQIQVTGNTVIDALLDVAGRTYRFPPELAPLFAAAGRRRILLTTHRRESHGAPMAETCAAVRDLVERFPDLDVIFPVHRSPRVREVVAAAFAGAPRVHRIEPLDYEAFVHAMRACDLILTDSGGIQEEAPSLGKPVLVLRETTERPEAIAAGTALLVGTRREAIVREASRLLTDPAAAGTMASARNPFGDGQAARRIVDRLAVFLGVTGNASN